MELPLRLWELLFTQNRKEPIAPNAKEDIKGNIGVLVQEM